MITITVGAKEFQLYGSIKELPIARYKLMQQYLLQDSGIGSTISDVDDRLAKLIALMQASKHDESIEEVANLRYAMFSAITGLDFKTTAFACFVYKVDGTIWDDVTPDGLSKIVDMFDKEGATVQELEDHWESVKKKLIRNFEHITPDGSEMTLNSLRT